jgi:hypothetical protein
MSTGIVVKKNKTFDLKLTKAELIHLRDIMSVVLPPDANITLSQQLAELEDRTPIESLLWKKVYESCKIAGLPLDEEAPDYIIAPATSPTLKVFHMSVESDLEQEIQGEE